MRCRFPADAGAVTAEFAAVLPAVALVLACGLGSMRLAGEQLRLQAAVDDAARLVGRGAPGAEARVREAEPAARLSRSEDGDLVCLAASAPASFGVLLGFSLGAGACVLDEAQ